MASNAITKSSFMHSGGYHLAPMVYPLGARRSYTVVPRVPKSSTLTPWAQTVRMCWVCAGIDISYRSQMA